MQRTALGCGTRVILLSLAVVVLGGGPSSPLLPSFSSTSSTKITPRFGFAAAAATPTDTAIATAQHATTRKHQPVQKEEEHELFSWHDEGSSSVGRPLGLERNLAPAATLEELEPAPAVGELELDDPKYHQDSGSELTVLLEGCLLAATATSVQVKHDKPTNGNVAGNAIDGDPMTW